LSKFYPLYRPLLAEAIPEPALGNADNFFPVQDDFMGGGFCKTELMGKFEIVSVIPTKVGIQHRK